MISVSKCKFCGKELPMVNYALPGHQPNLKPGLCDCPESIEEVEGEKRKMEQQERLKVCSEVWNRSGVPKRFIDVSPDFNRVKHLLNGRWIYFHGDNGRGKTQAACETAKAFLVRKTKREKFTDNDGELKNGIMLCPSFRFIAAQGLLTEITSSWNRWDQNEEEVISRWSGVDLLIFDDLGKGVPNEFAAEKIFNVMDKRWSEEKLTIITSQYAINELAERYEKAGVETLSALMSRLDGECEKIRLDGPDLRLQ